MAPISSDPKATHPAGSSNINPTTNGASTSANGRTQPSSSTTPAPASSSSPQPRSQAGPSSSEITPATLTTAIVDTYRDLEKGEEYATLIEGKLDQFDEKMKLFYASLGIEWDANAPAEGLSSDEEEEEEEADGDLQDEKGKDGSEGGKAEKQVPKPMQQQGSLFAGPVPSVSASASAAEARKKKQADLSEQEEQQILDMMDALMEVPAVTAGSNSKGGVR
ncbi:hypothetical protein MKZ38_006145 [Zalerion maritima]|uniref:Uncharacterized protein n=1 Tax=Zalerion maritima TaxID=339359 RepID=A0AAD5RJ79_9PEZI|nr:hypothetical protein MKZ38_006145 [Zalerion maritima]